MMETQTKLACLSIIFLALLLAVAAYVFSGGASGAAPVAMQREAAFVSRVIDGDTLQLADNRTVRLIGINTPERGQPCYGEAKQKLEELTGGAEVALESDIEAVDQYDRLLRYIHVGGVFINLEMVRLGYAHAFPYGLNVRYGAQFKEAQEEAILNAGCIWKLSPEEYVSDNCIRIEEFNSDESGGDEHVAFVNSCSYSINITGWEVKDESRHIYTFPEFVLRPFAVVSLHTAAGIDNATDLWWGQTTPVWNNEGDTLFLRDAGGGLVMYQGY